MTETVIAPDRMFFKRWARHVCRDIEESVEPLEELIERELKLTYDLGRKHEREHEHRVKQVDAKLLRESLAYCYRVSNDPRVRGKALIALDRYAERVAEYCRHPDKAKDGIDFVCIDCGHVKSLDE